MAFLDEVQKKVKRAQDKYKDFEVSYRKYKEENLEREYKDLQEKAKIAKLEKRNSRLKTEVYGAPRDYSMDFFGTGTSTMSRKRKRSGDMWEY